MILYTETLINRSKPETQIQIDYIVKIFVCTALKLENKIGI